MVGADVFRTEHLWQRLTRGGFFPAQRVEMAAISAIDIAMWDAKGKALGVPVHTLLGGRSRDVVRVYGHVRTRGPDLAELADECRRMVDAGWTTLRLAVPAPADQVLDGDAAVRAAVRRMEVARDTVGKDVELAIDAHTRLSPAQAIRLCAQIEPLNPSFVEDPVRTEYPGALAHVRAHTRVRLAAGEHLESRWAFRPLIEADLVDVVRPDVCLVGGLTEAKKVADAAETHFMDVVPHNPLGPVATAASVHLAAACPNAPLLELAWPPGSVLADVCAVQHRLHDGALDIPQGPGLGVEVDLEAAERATPTPFRLPMLRRSDGSFTNW